MEELPAKEPMSPELRSTIVKTLVGCLVASPVVVMLGVVYVSHQLDERFEQERAAVHDIEARHIRMNQQQLDEMQRGLDR